MNKIHIITALTILVFVNNEVAAQAMDVNTFPYPKFNNLGVGTTNTMDRNDFINYKLTTASKLVHHTFIDPETNEETYFNGTIPFRILAEDWEPGEPSVGNTDFLSEARIYSYQESWRDNRRVYSLKKDGSLLLGENSNSQAFEFKYSLISDEAIYSQKNIYVGGLLGIGTIDPQSSIDLRVGHLTLNDNEIRLRDASDANHVLKYSSNFDGFNPAGPILTGYSGGILGTMENGENGVVYWNSDNKVGINQPAPVKHLILMEQLF
ncbi:MAG: hypothetical protein HND54_09610 [Bacteroidetes bacterium]|nr:hypothetical protein [Bacteroidota bacterium]NOG57976.1 hypothetical protein [Bacteroidota bacterium]